MPSSAAACNLARAAVGDPLIEAAHALAEREMIGAVWLGPDLTVVSYGGCVPPSVEPGIAATEAFIALIGLDDELLALRRNPLASPLRIPNTAVISSAGQSSPRMNLTVFWVAGRQQYLVLMGAILSEASSTTELDQEIRRRRLIEQDLAARSREYVRINEQLEQFAYVISHDLNAPLRTLRYLASDIECALDPARGARRDDVDLGRLAEAAGAIAVQTRRMSKMLTDLLDYARIGRVEECVETIDTRRLIDDIVISLAPTTTLALVVSGDWPTLTTAVAPLDLVLRNLVENAVKHHDQPAGRVEVRAELQARDVVFQISDDGRGIPPEWQAAIFEPFRKIDDAHHPESSGIGLALVKKTLSMLGGAITVSSGAPQSKGTTFTVRWPTTLSNRDSDS